MKTTGYIMVISLIAFSPVFAGNIPEPGTVAPDFTLNDADGQSHTLSDYQGSYVALYFYPKNNTPGCTKEACNLRDNFDILKEKKIVVLGVSYDNEASHKKFSEKHNLQFPLLADVDKKVSKMYDVKGNIGPKRITFIIAPDGKIAHVIHKVDTSNHATQILETISSQLKK